jgi:hypothetical protein
MEFTFTRMVYLTYKQLGHIILGNYRRICFIEGYNICCGHMTTGHMIQGRIDVDLPPRQR